MFLDFYEIRDIVAMSLIIGFIFADFFKDFAPRRTRDYGYYSLPYSAKAGFDWDAFGFSVALVAPAIILHELSHKLIALSFGLQATFHTSYFWLFIALLLKLMHFPFIFFVPAFVSIVGNVTPFQSAMIALAGPGMNFILFVISKIMTKHSSKKYLPFWSLSAKVNLFLFIFNMLPIPGFDGLKVYTGLIRTFI